MKAIVTEQWQPLSQPNVLSVEWMIAWLTTNQLLAKVYERSVETGEMLFYLRKNRIVLRRLT